MDNKLIIINPQEFGLEKTEAQKIEAVFTPMLEKMLDLEKEYNAIISLPIDESITEMARTLRLKYVKVRTGTDEIHKKAKSYYLAGGRFVDAWRNAQKFAAVGKEEELEKIEKHFEIIELEKKAKLNEERQKKLSPFVTDVTLYNLKEMSNAGFDELLSSSKIAYEARIAAEKKAEDDRIAKEQKEALEREEQRKENLRLKAEAQEREKVLEVERKNAEIERKKREKIELELKQKDEEEKAKIKKQKILERKAKAAPDKDKIYAFSDAISAVFIPKLSTEEGQIIIAKAESEIRKILRTMCLEIDKLTE